MRQLYLISVLAAASVSGACGSDGDDDDDDVGDDDGDDDGGEQVACDETLTLPDGFCAQVLAVGCGDVRHLAVSPDGIVFAAVKDTPEGLPGRVLALRDADGDGRAEEQDAFGERGGTGLAFRDGVLYLAEDGRVIRWRMESGRLAPTVEPDELVRDLPYSGDHPAKAVAVDGDGNLYVNIASASNACQVDNRVPGSPGVDPCPELAVRAGVWRFDDTTVHQPQSDGVRVATGVRNATALGFEPDSGVLYGAINGRDQLADNWPALFTEEDDQLMPSEELAVLADDVDLGWPYCFHDPRQDLKVLAPEYGGDGDIVGRCADVASPGLAMEAHAAPLSIEFYDGDQFPEQYRGGAFIAFHGSRFEPEAEDPPGYRVSFVPFEGGEPAGNPESFATGFAGPDRPLPDAAAHRPVGLAEGPDGELYVSDDKGGTIWKITYRPSRD